MRRATAIPKPPPGQPIAESHAWLTIKTLFPYLWRYRFRVVLALSCLVGAKVANVGVPLVFKEMIDGLAPGQQVLVLPVMLLALYGALRFSTRCSPNCAKSFCPGDAARGAAGGPGGLSITCMRSACAFTLTARPAASRATSNAARERFPA
jgi:hypothetical protein